jgi:spoIIIJ-associated protein
MIREFEGATEEEAIQKAIQELGLEKEDLEVEFLGREKSGFFKKGPVKIRIHVDDEPQTEETQEIRGDAYKPTKEFENQLIEFLTELLQKCGISAKVQTLASESGRLIFDIITNDTNLFIGKKGKNLDSFQFLTNVYANKLLGEGKFIKIVLDSENYRSRREDTLIRMALKAAQIARKTKKSQLLEPMNPFERRLIHTALSEIDGIHTESEGEGTIKQIRVFYTGENRS